MPLFLEGVGESGRPGVLCHPHWNPTPDPRQAEQNGGKLFSSSNEGAGARARGGQRGSQPALVRGSLEATPVPWTWASRPWGSQPGPSQGRVTGASPSPLRPGPPSRDGRMWCPGVVPRGPTLCSQQSAPTQTGPGWEHRLPASGPQGPGAAPPGQTLSRPFPRRPPPPHPPRDCPSAPPGRWDSFQGPG